MKIRSLHEKWTLRSQQNTVNCCEGKEAGRVDSEVTMPCQFGMRQFICNTLIRSAKYSKTHFDICVSTSVLLSHWTHLYVQPCCPLLLMNTCSLACHTQSHMV